MLFGQGDSWFRRRAVTARLMVIAARGIVVIAALLLSAACGGGDDEPGPETLVPQATLTAPQVTPVPIPTYDPDIPLVEFTSPDKGYSMGYPEGWQVEASAGGGTDMFPWMQGERRLALLQVTCNRQLLTPNSLMAADASAASTFGGSLNPADAVPVDIGGAEGKQNTYSISVGGLRVEHVVAYAGGEKCGWRISLSSYGPGTIVQFLPLFERIIASFRMN